VDLKELIAIPDVASRLKSPPKTDKRIGPSKIAWCEFHQAIGHNLRSCLTLGFQLDELVRGGFSKDYLQEPQGALTTTAPTGDQGHEVPIHGKSTPLQKDSLEEDVLPPSSRSTLGE